MACDRAFGTTPEASLIMTCISAPSTPAGLRPGHGAGGRWYGLRRHGRFEGGHAQGGPGAIRLSWAWLSADGEGTWLSKRPQTRTHRCP